MESAIHIFFRSKRIKLGALHTLQKMNEFQLQDDAFVFLPITKQQKCLSDKLQATTYIPEKNQLFLIQRRIPLPFYYVWSESPPHTRYPPLEQSLLPLSRRKDLAACFSFSLCFFMLLQFVLAASIDSANCTPASMPIVIINALARVNIEDKSEYILIKSKITINLDPYLKVMCLV